MAIRYEVYGTGEPALVLLHGWTNSSEIWGEHPNTLSRTHQVVTVDLAGHGESQAGRGDWTMDAFAGDVAAVVDQLALESIVLVGFSMGANVALVAAERMPDRVLGVVFVDALQDPEAAPTPAEADQLETLFRTSWGDTAFLRAFALTPDAPDSVLRRLVEMNPAQPREHWFPALRAAFAWRAAELIPTLQRTRVPVAAINTDRVATNSAALRRYLPSFEYDTIAGVGHAGILLQRVDDFDRRLLATVERFTAPAR